MMLWIAALGVALAAPVDRTVPPAVGVATPLTLPEAVVETLRPGLRVHWLAVPGVRDVRIEVRLGRGSLWLDGKDTPATSFTGDLWTVAAKHWSAAHLEQDAALHDVSLSAAVGLRSTQLVLSVPADELDHGIDLFGAVLHGPTFPPAEIRRSAADTVQNWTSGLTTDPDSLAWLADASAWYPVDDARSPRADLDAVRAVRSPDLRTRRARILQAAPADILVVGDFSADQLRPRLVSLLAGVGVEAPPADPLPQRLPGVSAVIGVDVPGADQAQISIRTAAPLRGSPDEPAMHAIDFAMGGQFLSRLNLNLREEKGWTYGGYSSYDAASDEASWSFGTEVAEANVGPALHEIQAELDKMIAGGVTPEEQAASATGFIAVWNTTLESAGSAASALRNRVYYNESLADALKRLTAVTQVDVATTAAVAARYLGASDRVIVIVGDRKAIEGTFEETCGAAVWYTPAQVAAGQVSVDRAQ